MQQADKQVNSPGLLTKVLSMFETSVGRKVMTGITGILLVGFMVGHLAGNLTLFISAEAFNAYAHKLESLKPFLYAIEIGLAALFIFHAVYAIKVTRQNKKARSQHHTKYVEKSKAGKPSRKSLSSQTMIYTGVVLGLFTIGHVIMFRFGPSIAEGYTYTLHGDEVRDLYRLVVEWFKNPLVTASYMAVMVLLGVHIRHGFWSAFQSLGAYHPRYTPLIYTAGALLAVALGLGFFVMPIYLMLFADPVSAGAATHALIPNL